MKKLTFILAILLFSITGFAKDLGGNYYMVSTGEKLNCKEIKVGDEYINATLENGEKVVVPTSQIKMYVLNGTIFEKLPVYINNINTNQEVFMQFVATRAGLRLYKYTSLEKKYNKKTGAYKGTSKSEHFVVFRGDEFHVEITDKNSENMFEFFRI